MKRPSRSRLHACCAALLVACWLVGCATSSGGFVTRFPSDAARWSQLLAQAKSAAHANLTPIVVGVASEPRGVFAYDLASQRLLFRAPAKVIALPLAAGELAIVPEAEQVTVRRLRDGAILHTLPSHGMHLVGAAGDAKLTAIVLSTGGTLQARSRLLLLEGERVSGDVKLDRALGAPAVLGGIAFVPHNRVHVSAVSARGEELARIRVQHDVASYAFAQGEDVYFGQNAVTVLDERVARGELDDGVLRLSLVHKLPGNPAVLPDTNLPAPAPDSALHRVAVRFTPTRAANGLAIDDGTLYLAYYRLLFGLAPDAGTARWVRATESDLVGVAAVPGGVIAVENQGRVSQFDHAGASHGQAQLGFEVLAASVRAAGLTGAAADALDTPVALQLEQAARDPDTRIVPARAFAAALLAPVEDDEAARALIAMCGQRDLPERVREASCEALVRRAKPSEAVIAALGVHADALAQRAAPPVGVLARSAAHAGDRRAVEPLLGQLRDPANASEDLAYVVRALARLGDATAVEPLVAFVRLYHADVTDDGLEAVLGLAMEAVVKLDKERARPLLEPIANDPLAAPGPRTSAERVLATLTPATVETVASEGGESSDKPRAPEGPPAHLTTHHLDEALAPVRPQLARCVRDAPEHPASARLVLVIEGGGRVSDVKTLPESVRACIAPLVQATSFPATKYGRRSVMSYVVAR